MKKSDVTRKKIYDYIEKNPGKSNSQISTYIGLSTVAILHHLQNLLKQNLIYKTGVARSTKYFIKEKENTLELSNDFFKRLSKDLSAEFDGTDELDLVELLNNLIALLSADGTWKYGLLGFIQKIENENHSNSPNEELLYRRMYAFFISFFEEERKRRKNGFFDGTESLKIIMNSYKVETYIDKLLFTQIATLPHFGRLRGATELFYGKLDQNRYLMEKSISRSIDIIIDYIKKNNIKHALFTPPTIKRQVQFKDILKDILEKNDISLQEIKCEKIKSDITHTLRPQKELRGYDRIINAKKSIIVEYVPSHFDKIIIFDDNFTTGATINFIAEKLRFLGYTGEIVAITITGNFEYLPGITDIGEI